MEKVLLVGSGAREHAMADALVRDGQAALHAAVAVDNPGITRLAKSVVHTESDIQAIVEHCREHEIQFCLVGPEKPLEEGVTDALLKAGFPCAAPSQAAARIETNKAFMRSLLEKYDVPGRIAYSETDSLSNAVGFSKNLDWRVAVKPLGLTSGKGVKVWGDHFQTPGEVEQYIREILSTGMSGHNRVLIEELLRGQEFTVHFFCDGNSAIPTPAIQDHKRAYDEDKGPNTGGMGSYSSSDGLLPFLDRQAYNEAAVIGQKIVDALRVEGCPFKGILYGQFMLTKSGPKIIEFNARFGDPEAMNTLLLLRSSYVDICRAIIQGSLTKEMLQFQPEASVVRYVVPRGYGSQPEAGKEVIINESGIRGTGSSLYYASCNLVGEKGSTTKVRTTRSRTLAVAGAGSDIASAQRKTQDALQFIKGDVYYRNDIGTADALARKVNVMRELQAE